MNSILVPSKEFRLNFPKYQKLVEKGISIIIVKRSKPIFRIEAIDNKFDNEVIDSLLDYEDDKKNFVNYQDVFN